MPKYIGIAFEQAEGKMLISFVAPADEIRIWGGVPHKTTDFLGGFQRPLSDRFRQIVDFFGEAGNTSPTAIVVAFRPQQVTLEDLPVPSGVVHQDHAKYVTVEIPNTNDLRGMSTDELAKRVHRELSDRIAKDPRIDEPESDNGNTNSTVYEEETIRDETEDGNALDDWGVDVGTSALSIFDRRIEAPEALAEYKRDLTGQIIKAGDCIDPKEAATLADERLRELFISLLNPAMIVDGQHRVWGAAECDRTVPFAVIGIINADWSEQVFQFLVINKQARAISGEFLASIVNSSLTNREIAALEGRLEAAGLSTYESKMLRLLNDDPDSPFKGMISRGLEKESRKITFMAAMALVRRWNRMNERDSAYKSLFREGLSGTNRERVQLWQTDAWKEFFFSFWHGIKNLYKAEQLWEPGTQLMYRASLEVLQDFFLTKKSEAGGITYRNPVELREDVEEFYGSVPAGFFHTEWKRKELLTEDGRAVLKKALLEMRVPGTKLKNLSRTNPLFTGAATKKHLT